MTHAWQERRTEGDAVIAPLAAHHAAAMDRVWWLEVCGATPGAHKIDQNCLVKKMAMELDKGGFF